MVFKEIGKLAVGLAVLFMLGWTALSPGELSADQANSYVGALGECCTGSGAEANCTGEPGCEDYDYPTGCIQGGSTNGCAQAVDCNYYQCNDITTLYCKAS